MKTFTAWMQQHNERLPENPVPHYILESKEEIEICKFMILFVLETGCANSAPYPPATLAITCKQNLDGNGSKKVSVFAAK